MEQISETFLLPTLEAPHPSPRAPLQFSIPLLPQRLVHPTVYFLPIQPLESDLSTAFQKRLDLLQAHLLMRQDSPSEHLMTE